MAGGSSWLRSLAVLFVVLGGFYLIASGVFHLLAGRERQAAEAGRLRQTYAAFHTAVQTATDHLSDQEGLAQGTSRGLAARRETLSGGNTLKNELFRILDQTPSRIRSLGYLSSNDRLAAFSAYVFRNYGTIETVAGPEEWNVLRKRVGVPLVADQHLKTWSLMRSSPVGGVWNATILYLAPDSLAGGSGGVIAVESTLNWLADILAMVAAFGGVDVACLLPEGLLCTLADGELHFAAAAASTFGKALTAEGVDSAYMVAVDTDGKEYHLAETLLPDADGDILAVKIANTGWRFAMRASAMKAVPSFSWRLPLSFLLLALAALAVDFILGLHHRSIREDTELLRVIKASESGRGGAPGSNTARRAKSTTAFMRRGTGLSGMVLKRLFGMSRDTQSRMESELRVARRIQFSLVPARFPAYSEWREFDLYSFLSPAREVGGDYYDFLMRDANRIVFAVGDVSGKGVPAAMYMAVCRTAFRILTHQTQQPGELLTRLNDMLIRDNHNSMYITIACFFVDLPTGRCLYSLGGHPPPLLYRYHDDSIQWIDSPREAFVGLKAGIDFPVGELRLRHGDTLLLYTDGVTDAKNPEQEELGPAGLRDLFAAGVKAQSCKTVVSTVEIGVRRFVRGNEQTDDVTLSGFRYWGPGGQRVRQDTQMGLSVVGPESET